MAPNYIGAEIDHRNAEDDDTAPTVFTIQYPVIAAADIVSLINEDERSRWVDAFTELIIGGVLNACWKLHEAFDRYGDLTRQERHPLKEILKDQQRKENSFEEEAYGQKAKHQQEEGDFSQQCIKEDEIMQQKKEKLLCKICYINQLNVLFLPCSHMVACSGCASKLKRCAVCRADIKEELPVYFD